MTYRTDKFAVGDKVVWSEKHGDAGRDLHRDMGEGPFSLESVIDRPYDPPSEDDEYGFGQSNWSAMGHTQHVTIAEFPGHGKFSGAFFLKEQPK